MKLAALFFLLLTAAQMPKNDPNGIWQSESGTGYEIHAKGSDLTVTLVKGSSPTYVQYEVKLKNKEEVNTYAGSGFFVAKLQNKAGEKKECRFDTDWEMVVVSPSEIIGSTTKIVPDPETCAVKEKDEVQLHLKKN